MRWGKIRAAWTKTGPGYWDWGPEVALVAKLVAAPVEERVAKWASDLVGRVVVKPWEKVRRGGLSCRLGRRSGDMERRADGFAPGIGAEGLTEFVLSDRDGLDHGLAEIGERRGDFGFYIAAGNRGEESSHGGAKIASGEQIC